MTNIVFSDVCHVCRDSAIDKGARLADFGATLKSMNSC